jgi:hypothetical protein
MASYLASSQPQANSFSANADQSAAVAQFLASRSPRFAFSALSGD